MVQTHAQPTTRQSQQPTAKDKQVSVKSNRQTHNIQTTHNIIITNAIV